MLLPQIGKQPHPTDIVKDITRSWNEPWKYEVEDIGNIDEYLNKLPQDHAYVIETVQENFSFKLQQNKHHMKKNITNVYPVSSLMLLYRYTNFFQGRNPLLTM